MTPLMRVLRRAASRAARRANPSRRDFVAQAAAAVAAAAAVPSLSACGSSRARGRERIVIVGAGIAGLVTAMRLRDAGIGAAVYESSDRVGGRMHSERGYWDDGQHSEWCGAMVDTSHVTIRGLAGRFGIPAIDTYAARPPHARDTCFLDGRYYSMSQADRDFAQLYPILQAQADELDDVTTYRTASPEARRLDAMSVQAWIERYVSGGANSQLGRLIAEAYRNEYGRENSELSAINVVAQLAEQRGFARDRELSILGASDQRYVLARGSQALPEAIAASLPAGSIAFGHRLLAIARRSGGSYELTFATADGTKKVVADRVVLALPFIVLRGVDYASAGFDAAKTNAIDRLGYGYHTKLHVQFRSRPWLRTQHPWPEPTTGQIYTTLPMQTALDFSMGQPGADGLIEVFTGAAPGMNDLPQQPYARVGQSPAVRRHVDAFFEQLDRIWPGVSPQWNGKAAFGNAQADPNILASYSCWLVGQCTTIAGHEATPQGRVHFAGEHTSLEFQGFMEGGAESGMRAAGEILNDYKIAPAR